MPLVMAKSETIIQIAEAAGVSPTTVSMVINGKADKYRISQATQEKVKAVIAQADFIPNQAARSLRTNKTATLGLIVPDLSSHYFSNMAKIAEGYARTQGYQLLIVDSDNQAENEKQLIEELQLRGVDGMVVATTQSHWMHELEQPVVFLDRGTNAQQSVVMTDNETATFQLVTALIERNVFNDEVYYIGGDVNISTARERWSGFKRAFIESDLDIDRVQRFDGSFNKKWGYEAMQRIHSAGVKQGCLFMGAQMLIEGVLEWWQQTHDLIPGHLHLCGFDDHPFFNYLTVPISTVEQDIAQLARTAVDQLIQHIDNPECKPVQRIVAGRMHIRH